jgi:hypothetical protein
VVSDNAIAASKRRLFQLPLLRRESMGPSYHVLTFDAGQEIVAFPGQFAMVRGATWGQAPLLPRPMSLLESQGAARRFSSKSSAKAAADWRMHRPVSHSIF